MAYALTCSFFLIHCYFVRYSHHLRQVYYEIEEQAQITKSQSVQPCGIYISDSSNALNDSFITYRILKHLTLSHIAY